jgi:hypothetical protein
MWLMNHVGIDTTFWYAVGRFGATTWSQ